MLMANFVLFQFHQGEGVVLTRVRINHLASNTAFDPTFDRWGNFSDQIQCSVHFHMVHTVQIHKLCASYISHGNCSLLWLFLGGEPTLFLSMSVNLLYFFLKASTLHSASKPNLVSSSPSIQLVQFDATYHWFSMLRNRLYFSWSQP